MQKQKRNKLLIHFMLLVMSVFTLGPFLWMVITSFKTFDESIHIPMIWLPERWQIANYAEVWNKFPFGYFYFNTFLVMFIVVVGQIIICSLAAYAFARLKFPGSNIIFLLCLSLMMVPSQIFTIPHYEIMIALNLVDTVTALWLPRLFSVFGVFMLRQFFMSLPKELDEAAKIDGAGYLRIFWQILLPLVQPAIISLSILTALATWKDLMWPLIINSSYEKMTLSAGLGLLIGEHTTIYPLVMAGAVIAVWPMILLFFFFQRQFIQGIALTGTKA